ncbi:hypothetical protein P9112_006760 [Eukaryota sp. TZLM1-RC]
MTLDKTTVTTSLLHELYLLRCKDLGESPSTQRFDDFQKSFPSITSHLKLRDYAFGPYSAAVLSKLIRRYNITSLDLSDNILRDPGTSTIISCPVSLTSLNISGNNISDSLTPTIVSFLTNNSTLTTFALGHSPKNPPTYPNIFTPNSLSKIIMAASRAPSLANFNISGLLPSSDHDIIDDVSTSNDGELVASSIGSLLTFCSFSFLSIGGLGFDSENLVTILNTSNAELKVSHLDLSFNNIGPQGIDYFCERASQLKSIKSIILDCNPVENDGFKRICEVSKYLTNLEKISLSNCLIEFDETFWNSFSIITNGNIKQLTLSHNNQSRRGSLIFEPKSNPFRNINHSLQFLDFSHCKLYGSFCQHFGSQLNTHKTCLKHLNLKHCLISGEQAVELFQLFSKNISLEYLNLSDNLIGSESANELISLLGCSTTVFEVNLNDNRAYHDLHSGIRHICNRNKKEKEKAKLSQLRDEVSFRSHDVLLLDYKKEELKSLQNLTNSTFLGIGELEQELTRLQKVDLTDLEHFESQLMSLYDKCSQSLERIDQVMEELAIEEKGFNYHLSTVNERYQRELSVREAVEKELKEVEDLFEEEKSKVEQEKESLRQEKQGLLEELSSLRGPPTLDLDFVEPPSDDLKSSRSHRELLTPKARTLTL